MNTKYSRYLAGVLVLILMLLLSGVAVSQDYFYVDKLFGKRFVFTPEETKVAVKFSIAATGSSIQDVIGRNLLSLETDGLEKLHFGVFSYTKGLTFEAVKEQLLSSNVVAGVMHLDSIKKLFGALPAGPVFGRMPGFDELVRQIR